MRHFRGRRSAATIALPAALLLVAGCADAPVEPHARSATLLSTQAANLLIDPGFEAKGQGWSGVTKGGRGIDSAVVHGGRYSLRILASSAAGRAVYQDVPIVEGTGYDADAWMNTSALAGPGAMLILRWLNAAGLPEVLDPATVLRTDTVAALAGTQGWTRVAGSYDAPAGAVAARVLLSLALEPDNAGRVYFDDVGVVSTTVDAIPPTVAVTSPAAGETLTGTALLAADAADDVQLVGVRFLVGGAEVAPEDLTAPYSVTVNTWQLAEESHTITAEARDAAGNVTVSAPVTVTVDNPPRPDIVLIVTDDQRFDLMQYMPLTASRLVPDAVQFTHAFAPTPSCCPARATILTGQYSHNTGVFQSYLPNGGATKFNPASTIATWLQPIGYRTGIYGKYLNDYVRLSPAVPPGWSEFHAFVRRDDSLYYDYTLNDNGVTRTYGSAEADYSTTVITDKAGSFIASTPPSQPLFLYFTPFGPHEPAKPHPSDVGTFASLPPHRPPSYNEADVSDKPAWVRLLAPLDSAQMAASDAFHASQVETLQSVDRAVVALIDALVASGRWGNTILVFTSDNGLMWGEHRIRDTKFCPYDECVRIPLLVRAPGVAPRVDDHLVSQVDLAPTIAEWAGAFPATRVNGMSLVPLLADAQTPWRGEVLLESLKTGLARTTFSAVRTSRYLYAEYANGDRELYDLQSDPFQLTNVAKKAANAALVTQLKAKLAALKAQ